MNPIDRFGDWLLKALFGPGPGQRRTDGPTKVVGAHRAPDQYSLTNNVHVMPTDEEHKVPLWYGIAAQHEMADVVIYEEGNIVDALPWIVHDVPLPIAEVFVENLRGGGHSARLIFPHKEKSLT